MLNIYKVILLPMNHHKPSIKFFYLLYIVEMLLDKLTPKSKFFSPVFDFVKGRYQYQCLYEFVASQIACRSWSNRSTYNDDILISPIFANEKLIKKNRIWFYIIWNSTPEKLLVQAVTGIFKTINCQISFQN